MASIKQRPSSPYWVCCYRKANGERVQRSTKQTEREQAWAVCLSIADAERKAGQGTLTEAHARRIIAEIVERATGEPLGFYTTSAWFTEWLAGKAQTKSAGTSVRYAHVVDCFLAHLGKRAELSIAHISPSDVKGFRDAELKAGKSAKTCNLAVKTISAALNAARRQGLIQSNPAEALEALPHRAATKGTFTPEEVGKLLDAAPTLEWRGVILVGYFIGARLRDIADMKWEAVDLTAKVIRYIPRKTARTGKQVIVPIHPDLEAYLLSVAGRDDATGHLFPSLAGKRPGGAHGLSKSFSDIMGRAGIAAGRTGQPKGGKGRVLSQLSFHSLRHGFNSALANRGVAQEVRQALTGHASREMNANYTHLDLTPLQAAVAVIPSPLKTK